MRTFYNFLIEGSRAKMVISVNRTGYADALRAKDLFEDAANGHVAEDAREYQEALRDIDILQTKNN